MGTSKALYRLRAPAVALLAAATIATLAVVPSPSSGSAGSGSFSASITESSTPDPIHPNCYKVTTKLSSTSASGTFDQYSGNLSIRLTGTAPYQNSQGTFDNPMCTGTPGAATGQITVQQVDTVTAGKEGQQAACALSGTYGIANNVMTVTANGQCHGTKIAYPPTSETMTINLNYSTSTATGNFTATGSDTQAPTAPTNVSQTGASCTMARLAWSASSDNHRVRHYNVERYFNNVWNLVGQPAIATFEEEGLSPSDVDPVTKKATRQYRISAVDPSGNQSTPTSFNAVTPQCGDGAWADIYDNIDFTGTSTYRIDPTINFLWWDGSPDPLIGPDTFSIKWAAHLLVPRTGSYTFCTNTDNGTRLWIDDTSVALIDYWVDGFPATEKCATVNLSYGRHWFRMDYFEGTGGALAEAHWSGPGIAKQIIPQKFLYNPWNAPVLQ